MRNKNRKYLLGLIVVFSILSCKRTRHEFYFDIKHQMVISCDKVPMHSVNIENDSVKSDGFLYEAGALLVWKGDISSTPCDFSFEKIPKEYQYFKGGILSKSKFEFKPNSKYILEKFGGGSPSFKIRIWTDSAGKIFKTTHPKCDLKTLQEAL